MRSSERCVFDANVIVSALLFPDSKPGRAFFTALRSGSVLISDMLMSELRNVLYRPKFDRYISPDPHSAPLWAGFWDCVDPRPHGITREGGG